MTPRVSARLSGGARAASERQDLSATHGLFIALCACLCASAYQGYLFNLGINVTIYLLCVAGSIRYVSWGLTLGNPFAIACLALILVEIASLSWSPDVFLGIKDIFFGLSFIIVVGLALTLRERDPDALVRAVRIYCVVTLGQSLMVILFRLAPSIESAFWGSPIGGLFISPGALNSDVGVAGSNVTDPDKAGGVLLAANTAGAWSAALGFLTIAAFRDSERRGRARMIAAIHFVAVFMCGSKASLGIFAAIVGILLLRWLLTSGADARKRALIWLALIGIGMAVYAIGPDRLIPHDYSGNSKIALSTRSIMWKFAIGVFQQTPWQGLGYGGWREAFFRIGEANRSNGVSGDLAPHNMFLDLWTQSGMFAVIAGAIIVLCAYWYIIGAFWRGDKRAPWLFAALSAYIVQSMGENYMLFSSAYISSVLALSVILALRGGTLSGRGNRS